MFGTNLFVAVGQDGDTRTSTNGLNWVARVSPAQAMLNGITYGNGLFVAVGWNGAIVTSPDGTNWASQYSGTTTDFNGVGCGTNGFVAVGDFGLVIWSPDGTNWGSKPFSLFAYYQAMRSVAYANGNYVVVGDQGTVITSPDGITWNTPTYAADNDFYGVVPAFGGFTAVGKDGVVLQSSESIVPPKLGPIELLARGAALVTVTAAAGQTNSIQASTDLVNWLTFTNLVLTNVVGQFVDPSAPGFPRRFYRTVAP